MHIHGIPTLFIAGLIILVAAASPACGGDDGPGRKDATVASDAAPPGDAAPDAATMDAAGPDAAADAAPDAAPDAGPDASANLPPEAVLLYEIQLNVWVLVNPGDTVVRPLDADINWDACSSQDPDGAVAEIWLSDGVTTQLYGPGIPCVEFTETDHSPRNNLPSYLLVIDDQGAETRLSFTYRTE